ncbi:bifunctional transcriptional activator/DNA repair enzyme AdaA [Legionella micdadei]|uniref:methylated-DNA--[protein]-cysteine S-methyltransferase n=1 Tax=Legionella micdadei TaxID=451 RepID=A0A098GEW2_LEGMI|nr:trifunctional transcriptional activator/DNA repair protein Ada/methylated-DNA--[protein]-cysteine S-methyltransferase [Legionella micdadei]ARG97497.1 bifunctional transcriptional activator/DNA repair enzyme protein Ada [Legionella micdadei]KTD28394.1 Ada protein (O6-methylguanine-DNA methyltransferase) [Legionella micdadei]NSL17021.1 bifunctional transcriptional activator/DNA repair protein Ada [Legionella micdadei]CEG61013.1 Methylated-DNA/protein-cysteine methyltransferase [Legionella micd
MFSEILKNEYYRAMLDKNLEYDGIFYVGVKTTGVFCRSICPARKPKFENCEFFETAQQALLASFRPCKRCQPLSHPSQVSQLVKQLVEAIEKNPEKRWKNEDFQQFSAHAATARRQFKKRFGMTFVEYARARRIGLAMNKIRNGMSVIEAQIETGYGSGSGFRDAFSQIMGVAPAKSGNSALLKAAWLDTMLGPMIAIASETELYLLEFVDRRGLELEVERLRKKTSCAIIPGLSKPLMSIDSELKSYFQGTLQQFKTPIKTLGSPFQEQVWDALNEIPYGETQSYSNLANSVGKPKAYRAVAKANGANQLCLIIPCHRVINHNGDLGGYGGGLTRKKWLIEHENKFKNKAI